jgi:ubiquinone/menaquinone biosynthesis C-methylase UbiE
MFSKTAYYYDKIYSFKNYRAEVQRLIPIIRDNLGSGGNRLLDVACGTGRHIEYLKEHFQIEGLDISEDLLEFARKRNPEILFHQADMVEFQLGRTFDVVICLFSSIGYVKTLDKFAKAINCMTNHLVPGGVLIIEPWFTPETWHPGTVHAVMINEPNLKIARINTSYVDGRLSFFDMHYLIGTPEKTEYFVEHHELGLFKTDEMREILVETGLEVTYDATGLTGRGFFIGRKSKSE